MSRSKYDPEQKIKIVQSYLDGISSVSQLAEEYGLGKTSIKRWVAMYCAQGARYFFHGSGNRHYSKEFKLICVNAVLRGDGSVNEIVAKYNISNERVLRHWIKCYNANMELKDYEPKPEVYMAEARRKTTLEERKEIVDYCISHDNDYTGAASKYSVSYSHVYSWVTKYREKGEEGLEDKRGHHKSDDELDELELLRRENKRLKQQLEERDMLCELLKKVRELEGM